MTVRYDDDRLRRARPRAGFDFGEWLATRTTSQWVMFLIGALIGAIVF
ncbi:MAG: hypothetical protein AB7N54_13815 [Alphaproteobacteria bacterium]